MGARRIFSRGGGAKPPTLKTVNTFSARPRRKRKVLRFLRRFRLKYKVSMASAEGGSEKFRVFCRTVAYDVTFFLKFHGGGARASFPPHLQAPMFAEERARESS